MSPSLSFYDQPTIELSLSSSPAHLSPSSSTEKLSTVTKPSSSPSIQSPPSSLAFLNLRYEVTNFGQVGWPKKALLRRLNGSFHAGSLNGLLGESGSGKTTLLSALCGKSTSGLNPSSSLYLGKSASSSDSYFVQQHILETIEGSLTVRQLLHYAYLFKNGLGLEARRQMEGHIARVTEKLLLNSDRLLHRRFSVCSGGEQRRISVAQELMSLRPPSFLFLDEPTTGLDSYAALELVKCLSELTKFSNSGLTIVASIHAPSSELLTYFSKLYVLAKGMAIFSGPPHTLKPVLEKQLGKGVVSKGEQPIEALIRISCADLGDDEEGAQKLQKLAQHTLKIEYKTIIKEIESSALQLLPAGLPNSRKTFSFCDLYLAICRHFRVTFLANGLHLFLQMAFILFTTTGFSRFYPSPAMVIPDGCYTKYAPNSNSSEEVSCGRGGSLLRDFHLTENINFQSINREDNACIVMLICALLYSVQMSVFRSEHRNRWYSMGVFYWASEIVCSAQMILFTGIISIYSYFLVSEHAIDGYRVNWVRLGHFVVCIAISTVHGQALGQLVGIAFSGFREMICIMLVISYTMHLLLNDFLFKSAEISVVGYRVLADILGMKHVTRYLVYVFYGIDRCEEAKSQASWVLEKYDVPEFNQLMIDLVRLLLANVLGMKVAAFVVMYFRFRGGGSGWSKVKGDKKDDKKGVEKGDDKGDVSLPKPQMLPVDFPTGLKSSHLNLSQNNNDNFFVENGMVKSRKVSLIKDSQIIIAWRDLTLLKSQPIFEISRYTSSSNNIKKAPQPETVLNNLNGQFTFGSLNAVMGMSGAGKTTFLRLLNGQEHHRLNEDSRLYLSNCSPLSTVFLTQEVDGHLMRGLTSRQLLVYASKLKNAQRKVDHQQIALKLLEELNLIGAAYTKVERLSGGERKRLALALELTSVVMPNLILVDECTSGLDSNSAAVTISTLRTFTHSHPITIVVSIHQPNSELLSLFDSLYVLASGGHAVYSGPPGGVQAHLNQLHKETGAFTKDELLEEFKSEFPIETLIKYSSLRAESSEVVRRLETITRLATTNMKLEKALSEETIPLEDVTVLVNRVRFSFNSVLHLSSRYLAYMAGYQWKLWLPFIIFYLVYAFNLTFFFPSTIASVDGCLSLEADFFNSTLGCSEEAQKQREIEKHLYSNVIYNFFVCNLLLMIVLLQTPLNLLYEMPIFVNEHRNGWYSTGAWYLTKVVFEMLPLLPVLAGYVWIVNIYDQYLEGGMYWSLLSVMVLAVATAQGFVYVVFLAVDGAVITGFVLGTATMLLQFQLSNVFTSLYSIHYFYQMQSYFAFVRWPLQALLVREYGFGRCSEKQVQPILDWLRVDNGTDGFTQAIIWMFINLLFWRGIPLWMLIWKVNPGGGRGSFNKKERLSNKEEDKDTLEDTLDSKV